VVYQSVCNLLLLEMRAKRLYLRPSYLIGLDWIEPCVFYVRHYAVRVLNFIRCVLYNANWLINHKGHQF